jgi:nucleolar protein 15
MTKEAKKPLLHSKLERFARLKKLAAKLVPAKATTGLLIVSHLPDGFDEFALKNFFKQFGRILRVKLSRGKKSGRSRGYGFLEFEERETAVAAAEAMHGFLMFGKQLVCRVVDEVAPYAFTPCKRHPKDPYPEFRTRYNSVQTPEEVLVRVKGMLEREAKLKETLRSQQIDYEFPGFKALVSTTSH